MSDTLIDVVWAGPFHSDQGSIGSVIQVTREQAKSNPGWFHPVDPPKARKTQSRKPRAKNPDPVVATIEPDAEGNATAADDNTETGSES